MLHKRVTNQYPSARARIIERRTYLRPLNDEGTVFETPDQMLDRVIGHQRWLWEKQVGRALNVMENLELQELRNLMDAKLVSASGRVKWMGGTDVIKERSAAAFNCSFEDVKTPADMVDAFWLLLQGTGVGFKPINGLLSGFAPSLKNVVIIPSTRTDKGGAENTTSRYDADKREWTIQFGDSAKAWAKAIGKLLDRKHPAETLVLDLSQLRPGGKRLRGYGWLSSGWQPLATAMEKIALLLINAGDRVLTAIEIGDILNLLGTVLSSRRSAEIWLLDDTHKELDQFVDVKLGGWQERADAGVLHREQSNNSILFWNKPSRETIKDLLARILRSGDPGFINAAEARRRAPEFDGVNPCAEILLPSKGFCNLFQVVFHRFNGNLIGLERALYLAGRANYRQACVSMRDGVLQPAWDDNQKLLRLCGVSPTGYVSWDGMNDPEMLEAARDAATLGANDMADEFGTPRPRRVTQVQPAGTSSKVLGLEGDEVHEGAHLADSRWIINNVNISNGEPLLDALVAAGYRTFPNPSDPTATLVAIPVAYPESPLFTKVTKTINGVEEVLEVNQESAVDQLERYRILMQHYVDHNCSITISFDETEIDDMADWFMANWNAYVGVSFLRRNDPTLTAADLGFDYLPQEPISRRMYDAYAKSLLPVDLAGDTSQDLLDMADCATGICPVR